MKLWPSFVVVASLLVTGPGPVAEAQPSPEAETLFRDGKQLIKDGKIAEACDAFEASQRLEPNIATLLNLADCRERNGQLATAWALFLDAGRRTRTSPGDERLNATAGRRATALEGRLSYLTISVADDSRVPGLEVERNGARIEPGTWNRAVPLDGGDYVIAGKAPGHEAWSTRVTIDRERGRHTVEVPRFKELATLAPTVDAAVGAAAGGGPRRTFTTRRKVAVGVGAAGLVAVGVGSVLGLSAKGLWDDAQDRHRAALAAGADTAPARRLQADAESRANLSTIAFAAGAAAITGGVVLWFLGAPEDGPQLSLTPTPRGAAVAVQVGF